MQNEKNLYSLGGSGDDEYIRPPSENVLFVKRNEIISNRKQAIYILIVFFYIRKSSMTWNENFYSGYLKDKKANLDKNMFFYTSVINGHVFLLINQFLIM